MDIKIPSKFQIFGHTYNVQFDDNLINERQAWGEYHSLTKTIMLQSSKRITIDSYDGDYEYEISENELEETFIHELTHAIFEAIGEDKLSSNERVVGTFSKALHQAFKTMK